MSSFNFADDRAAVLAALESGEQPPPQKSQPPAKQPPPQTNDSELRRMFCIAAKNNDATVCEIGGGEGIPAAVAAYLKERGMPPKLLCAESLVNLNWNAAGVAAECRPAKDSDGCAATEIIAAAADTGAMMVGDNTPHQLTHSILPPAHIAILRVKNIVGNLPALWKIAQSETPPPKLFSLICGPSRTADIEQTLTLGAHGPVTVHIIIVNN